MQFSIDPSDIKAFLASGHLTLEDVISEEEARLLSCPAPLRDPHRDNPLLWKLATSRRLALMAAHLSNKIPLRLAFTEWVEGPINPLTEWVSIQPITMALFLEPNRQGTFLTPQTALTSLQRGLLIAYAPLITLYTYNLLDPHVHALKKLGYAFGDRLGNQTHPLVCKDFFS